jgi:hypothetical protein
MNTGNIESWGGNISEIGPLYPFVGSEVPLFIVGMALWIIWHVLLIRTETSSYENEIQRFGDKETLRKILDSEDPYAP